MNYPNLMHPLTLRDGTIPNRLVFPPIFTNYASENGKVTERFSRFYTHIASNNVGLTILGATGISPDSRVMDHAFCLYNQEHVASAKPLFKAMQVSGSVPAVQLNHCGRAMRPEMAGAKIVGPSAVASPTIGKVPHELTINQIQEIVAQFIQAAVNAKEAGALMVEFHGAHSYLLNQFMSPAANLRKDQYGGDTEKRALIVREILQQAREQLGASFIIGLRMSVDEYVEGGLRVDESAEMVNMFVDDGLDIINVSAGGADSGPRMIVEAAKGNLIKLAGQIKERVNIPVIAVGGLLNLDQAEAVVEQGLADMVAMGRALIADPALITKTLEGRKDEIVECTSCMQCFLPSEDSTMVCTVNQAL